MGGWGGARRESAAAAGGQARGAKSRARNATGNAGTAALPLAADAALPLHLPPARSGGLQPGRGGRGGLKGELDAHDGGEDRHDSILPRQHDHRGGRR